MGKCINKKFKICLLLIFMFITYGNTYVIATSIESPKIIHAGMFHGPILEGERVEFYTILDNIDNPLFRVFIDDGENEIELTEEYIVGNEENGYYKLSLDKTFVEGNYRLKIWVKNTESTKLYDCETYINAIKVISDDDYNRELISQAYIENINIQDKNIIEEYVDINVEYQEDENIDINEDVDSIGNNINSSIDDKITDKTNDKVREEWENEADKIVQEALLNQDQMIIKDSKRYVAVGDEFIVRIKDKDIIEDTSNTESLGIKYKLHIYDLINDQWEYDDQEYREACTWTAEKPGIYLLTLWSIESDSLEMGNEYDSWRIIPVIVENEPKVEIELLLSTHMPIYEGDNLNFYVKSRSADKVQYRAWIISEDTKEIIDATNGYDSFVDAEKYYSINIDENLPPGEYFLWIWVRDLNSNESYDNYFSYKFTCLDKENRNINTMDKSIMFDKEEYIVGDTVVITGIEDVIDAKFKLHIFDIEENKWISLNDKYEETLKWTPEKAGEFLVNIWIKNNNRDSNLDKEYDAIKLKLIQIKEDDVGEKEESHETIKFTSVTDFEELFSALDKEYKFIIRDSEVRETYLKSIEVINEIIDKDMDDFEKVLQIHEYIVKNTEYALDEYLSGNCDSDLYTPYGVLIRNKAVCQGYADTFKIMLDLLGIENYLVQGTATYSNGESRPHAWNLVNIEGEYYHIDSTWNDPVPNHEGMISYRHFLMNDEEASKLYQWDKAVYPKANSDKYNYFWEMSEVIIEEEWIIYSNALDNYNLYKMKIDGSNKVKICNSSAVYIASSEKWIYFSNYSYAGYMFKVRKDSLGLTQLNNEYSIEIKLDGEWITYKNVYDQQYYRMKTDGTNKEKL